MSINSPDNHAFDPTRELSFCKACIKERLKAWRECRIMFNRVREAELWKYDHRTDEGHTGSPYRSFGEWFRIEFGIRIEHGPRKELLIEELSDYELRKLKAKIDERLKVEEEAPWRNPRNNFARLQKRLLEFLFEKGIVDESKVMKHVYGSLTLNLPVRTLRNRLRQLQKASNDRLKKLRYYDWEIKRPIDRSRNRCLQLVHLPD